jgi:hypothetical protein
MRILLKWLFDKPITWLAQIISSSPEKKAVFHSLSRLLRKICADKKNKGLIKLCDASLDKIIIFSDQHKGTRDNADDFKAAEKNYLSALRYHHEKEFQFISLGDCEEPWKKRRRQM